MLGWLPSTFKRKKNSSEIGSSAPKNAGWSTLPETNSLAPKKCWLSKFGISGRSPIFRGVKLAVRFREAQTQLNLRDVRMPESFFCMAKTMCFTKKRNGFRTWTKKNKEDLFIICPKLHVSFSLVHFFWGGGWMFLVQRCSLARKGSVCMSCPRLYLQSYDRLGGDLDHQSYSTEGSVFLGLVSQPLTNMDA